MYRTKHQRVANRPGFAWCSLSKTLARKVGGWLAALLCSLVMGHQAHAQSTCGIWQANGGACQGFDASAVAACVLNSPNFAVTVSQPRDVASCGQALQPLNGCVWYFEGYVVGPAGASGLGDQGSGTFLIFGNPSNSCPQYFIVGNAQRACPCDKQGDPIDPAIGNVYTVETDVRLRGSGALAFQRFYNSADTTGADGVPG